MNDKLFDVKYIDLNVVTTEKFATIKHLANLMEERLVDVDKYVEDVKTRESMSTTGIGDGVAIPHAKSSWVKKPTVVVGKSLKGIEWQSLDDEPVHMVFLIAVPEGNGNEHLKILQMLAVSIMDDDFKEELENATDEKVIEKLLLDRTNN
ncbi:PTS sugar transporter subunit IIA [Clostridium gasigenes]|uniref:PTS system IIA component, Fru family n=1 Tax=Clostridium gasigenes TaxID=94869 RepID=A0A1H0PZA9_9CLOT|nr:fructose PTS transporter subunit IIA [Clostridium gasigenes]MBU3088176.1 fructose PTS transporter subunit IIA [Clostridium gasigenes]SDP09788.1 PTS system IIA component, Fru family [Clostridium gasigenes]